MTIFNIVIGIAANKSDLIEREQVNEKEARDYAKEISAIFKVTSACTSSGVDELFKSIGCKVLDPNYVDEDKPNNSGGQVQNKIVEITEEKKEERKIRLDSTKLKEGKKGCC